MACIPIEQTKKWCDWREYDKLSIDTESFSICPLQEENDDAHHEQEINVCIE